MTTPWRRARSANAPVSGPGTSSAKRNGSPSAGRCGWNRSNASSAKTTTSAPWAAAASTASRPRWMFAALSGVARCWTSAIFTRRSYPPSRLRRYGEASPHHALRRYGQTKNSPVALRRLPAACERAGKQHEDRGEPGEHKHLRPELPDWRVAPEDFEVAVERPGVERHEPELLHGFAHQETRKHASTQRRHRQDDDRGHSGKLRARARQRREHEAEAGRRRRGDESHHEEARQVVEEIE